MKKIILITVAAVAAFLIYGAKAAEETIKCTPAERMYEAIIAYADSFDVPLYVTFNIATL
jgi:hypothetical protein